MSEISQNKNSNSDEIDLLDLFRRMGNTITKWSKGLGKAFLISIVFLLRRWLPLGLSVVAGVGISYVIKSTSDSFYTSDMVVRNNINSKSDKVSYNADIISFINRLHSLCAKSDKTGLAEALSLDHKTVSNIKDINAFWIIDKGKDGIPDEVDYTNSHNIYDTTNVRMLDRFDIRVKISSPQELSMLQDRIVSFIKKDSVFQKRNRLRLEQINSMIARYNYDILQLDSLQKIKYFEESKNVLPKTGGQMVFLQEQKTQLLYSEIHSIYFSRQSLESERDLYPGIITVLSDFNLPDRPDNGTLFYGKIIIPFFFGCTLILLILIYNRKKIKDIYNKY
jgi:hypothetical protein